VNFVMRGWLVAILMNAALEFGLWMMDAPLRPEPWWWRGMNSLVLASVVVQFWDDDDA